jgi:hypothetical protein
MHLLNRSPIQKPLDNIFKCICDSPVPRKRIPSLLGYFDCLFGHGAINIKGTPRELSLFTYMNMKAWGPWTWIKGKKEYVAYCPKCGEYGYLHHGSVLSVYHPKHGKKVASVYPVTDDNKVVYGQYSIRYIRHYSPEKYRQKMEEYKSHKIKSRPNGQKRCYIPVNVKFRYNLFGRCMQAYCDYFPYAYVPVRRYSFAQVG